MDHGPHRGVDCDAYAVRDAMGDREEFQAEDAELYLVARLDDVQGGTFQELVFFELDGDEALGQARGVHGDRDPAEEIGQGACVVPVAVGDDHASNLICPLQDMGQVRDDQVDPQHFIVGEHEAGIDDDQVLSVFQDQHVPADLAQAPEGYYFQLVPCQCCTTP